MEVVIDNKKYEVIKNEKDALDISDLEGKITDYYDNFDYILGDYAYGKVRLKGFNDKNNKYFKPGVRTECNSTEHFPAKLSHENLREYRSEQ